MKDDEFERQHILKQMEKRYKPIKPQVDRKEAKYLTMLHFRDKNRVYYIWRNALGSVIRANGLAYSIDTVK